MRNKPMMNIRVSTIGKDKGANVGHVSVFNHRDGSRSDAEIGPTVEMCKNSVKITGMVRKVMQR
jgi:hypothetical protein